MDDQAEPLPPHSQDAEAAVLGCILLDSRLCLPMCLEKLPPGIDVFYDARHQAIYTAILEMFEAGTVVDSCLLSEHLTRAGRLDRAGGVAYLSSLPERTPSPHNLSYYLNILHEHHLLRKVVRVCAETTSRVYGGGIEAETVVDQFEQSALAVRQHVVTGEACIKDLIVECTTDLDNWSRGIKNTGHKTGFIDLDRIIFGLNPQDVFIIAARPSVGKTTFAMNIVDTVAIRSGVPTAVFSLEMSAKQILFKMALARARISRYVAMGEADNPEITTGPNRRSLTQSQVARLSSAFMDIRRAPLHLIDMGGITAAQIRARARRIKQSHGLGLVVVDYLQLVSGGFGRFDNRNVEVGHVSSSMKAMAKELNVPVLLLSQLNRAPDVQNQRKPRLSDLRESGNIEQDADIVGFLHPTSGPENDPQSVEFLVEKHRHGMVGPVRLQFQRSISRFESTTSAPY